MILIYTFVQAGPIISFASIASSKPVTSFPSTDNSVSPRHTFSPFATVVNGGNKIGFWKLKNNKILKKGQIFYEYVNIVPNLSADFGRSHH